MTERSRHADRLRVAIPTLYPRETDKTTGGVQSVSYNLVRGLRRYSDLELHVIHCHSDIAESATVEDGTLTVHYLAMPRRRLIPNMTTSIYRVQQLLAQLQPDVVNAHIGYYALAALRGGFPTVYTIHGVVQEEARAYRRTLFDRLRYWLYTYYNHRAVRRVPALIAISDYVLDRYQHMARGRWYRIDNPVTDDFFLASRAADEVPDRVFFVGSITEVKDLHTLLEAIALVRHRVPMVQLHIAGRIVSQRYYSELQHYVATSGLSSCVHFLGLRNRAELLRDYAEAAVVALSSQQENAPMAVIEAMAVGKPVVCTRVGGIPGLVVNGETGYIVAPRDPQEMADRIVVLLRDQALRHRMGRRGQEIALQRFSVAEVARQYRNVYREMAGLPPEPPAQV